MTRSTVISPIAYLNHVAVETRTPDNTFVVHLTGGHAGTTVSWTPLMQNNRPPFLKKKCRIRSGRAAMNTVKKKSGGSVFRALSA